MASFGLGKGCGTKLKGQQFGGQAGWEQAEGFQPTGFSGKATKPSPQLSKREDLKAGWQSPGFHLNSALKQLFIPEIHHPAAQRNIKCYWEQVLQFGGGEEFICSSTTAHPALWERVMLKKKLTAHLRQQKWRNISVEQTSPEYTPLLTDKDKATLMKLCYYCLFWSWFLFTWAK